MSDVKSCLLVGVGGQGAILISKIMSNGFMKAGYDVKQSEVHGMAQRGGNVTSHVRMGSNGEAVFSPLITPGTADIVIALEPGEAARALPFLAPGGVLVTATTAIQPVTAAATWWRLWRILFRRRRPASKRPRSPLRRMPRPTPRTPKPPVWKATRCPCSFP